MERTLPLWFLMSLMALFLAAGVSIPQF